MTVYLDEPIPEGPILASGKATPDGEFIAAEYFEIAKTIKALEERKEALRKVIIAAAEAEDPKAKFFPAGDHIIKISHSERRTIPVTTVERLRPDLFAALRDAELVNTTTSTSVSVT